MERFVSIWVQILYSLSDDFSNAQVQHMIHSETLYVVFLQIYPLVGIYISYRYHHQILKWHKILEPFETRDRTLRESTGVTCWITVVSVVISHSSIQKIRMSVNPNNLEIFIMCLQSMKSRYSDTMISTNSQHQRLIIFSDSCDDTVINQFQHGVKKWQIFYMSFIVLACFFICYI